MYPVGHVVLLNAGHILLFEQVIGDLQVLADLVYVHHRVTHHAPFGHLVFRLVLFVGGANFGLVRQNLGFQVFRLDECVIQLHLFILVAEFVLKFGGAHTDAIGHQLTEFFLKQALANKLLKDRHGQLEARLDFGGIAVHANKGATIEGRRNVLADAIGPLLIGNGDSEALGLVFDLLLRYQLLQDLLGVKRLEGLHVGIPLLNLVELLTHVLHAD